MTKRNVMITISTSRVEIAEELFDEESDRIPSPFESLLTEMPEPTDLLVEGRLVTTPKRVELLYEESELTGMEGSVTSIGFDRDQPGLISMIRTGRVETALVFEQGKRHFSVYDTPLSSFQVCVHTLRVENDLLKSGKLYLDYLVEIHGAQAEHCRMTVTATPSDDLGELLRKSMQ